MRRLLGEQADAFQASYLEPPVAGLRVNTLKIAPDDLRRRLPYHLKPLPWTQSGFQLAESVDDRLHAPGKHVYHAAGLYYLQEPSAMAVAELLNPKPGEAVLDLCAAPGGKTTHLAAMMGNQGVLIANETHPKRVWELAENLERWGARNTIITNEKSSQAGGATGRPISIKFWSMRPAPVKACSARASPPGGIGALNISIIVRSASLRFWFLPPRC